MKWKVLFVSIAALNMALFAAPAEAAGAKRLLYHGFFTGPTPTPSYIAANKAYIDTLPFDGLAVYMRNPDLTWNISDLTMKSGSITYSNIYSVLQPLAGLTFATVKNNYALVFAHKPGDFFDDAPWTTVAQNFANLAKAVMDAGLKGIIFDNEQYDSWGNYPDSVNYANLYTLSQYQDKARQRGQQVMAAMVTQFPDISVITLHGPYVSVGSSPSPWFNGGLAAYNELLGPFFTGFVLGRGSSALVEDGGELYTLRTANDFSSAYQWQKYNIANATDATFIPSTLKPVWSSNVSVGYGVYDKDSLNNYAVDSPALMQSNITNALTRADDNAWLYTESMSFLAQPGQPYYPGDTYIAAVRNGRAAALPATDILPPSAPANLSAAAVSPSQINLSWTASTDNVGVTGYRVFRGGVQIAVVTATSYQDAGLTSATSYTYTVNAFDAAGNVSPSAGPVTAATLNAAFARGQRVQTATPLNVRSKPNVKGKILCVQPAGALGTITGGPSNSGGYTWWSINYDTGCDGWSAQNYLVLIVSQTADLEMQIQRLQQELSDLLEQLHKK